MSKEVADAWFDILKKLGVPITNDYKKLVYDKDLEEKFERIVKLNMLRMMDPYNLSSRPVANLNMPIDPDGQVMALLKDIEDDVKALRELIISRGRE